MTGLTRAFARGFMLLVRQHLLVSIPEVAVQHAPLVRLQNALPQQSASGFATVTDGVSDDLAGSAALGQPNPAFVLAATNERSKFIEFQNIRLFGLCQRLLQGRQLSGFFKLGHHGVWRYAEDALHGPQRPTLMVGGQGLRFDGFIVCVEAFVFAAGLAAVLAFVALPSVLEAESDQVGAGAVVARNGLSDYESGLPQQFIFRVGFKTYNRIVMLK